MNTKPDLKRGFPSGITGADEEMFRTGVLACALIGHSVVIEDLGVRSGMWLVLNHARWFPDRTIRTLVDLVLRRSACPDEYIPTTNEQGLIWHVRAGAVLAIAGTPSSFIKSREPADKRASAGDIADAAERLLPFLSVDVHGPVVERTLRGAGITPHKARQALIRMQARN